MTKSRIRDIFERRGYADAATVAVASKEERLIEFVFELQLLQNASKNFFALLTYTERNNRMRQHAAH